MAVEALLSGRTLTDHISMADSEEQRAAVIEMAKFLRSRNTRPAQTLRLVGADDESIELPEPMYRLLLHAAEHIARGDSVSLVPLHKELTTQDAANLLNVSRPHVISLLDRGEIPYHATRGGHRRIKFSDLSAFKQTFDRQREAALDTLTHMTEDLGLYDLEDE